MAKKRVGLASQDDKQAAPLSEKIIESQILLLLEDLGIFAWKNQRIGLFDSRRGVYRKNHNRFNIKGTSDVLGLLSGGRFLAIEVKSKSGALSPEQRTFLAKVNNEGGLGFVARSIEQVIDTLRPHLLENKKLQALVLGAKH